MITYQLPRRIRYVPASAIFSADFNTPTPGQYNFNNQIRVFITTLAPNTVYMIDSMSIAGNIASETFLNAIDIIPLFTLQKTLNDEAIFDLPIQIHSFSTDRQIVHFFKTGLSNCGLNAKISGVLNQTSELIGVDKINLSINLSIHAIDESDFEKNYSAKG